MDFPAAVSFVGIRVLLALCKHGIIALACGLEAFLFFAVVRRNLIPSRNIPEASEILHL